MRLRIGNTAFKRGDPHLPQTNMTSVTAPNNQPAALTKKEQAANRYTAATRAISAPGEICKMVGSLGAIAGGGLMAIGLTTGNATSFALTGGIAAVAAAAGAPIAALGSIATQTKRSTKLAELDAWLTKEGMK